MRVIARAITTSFFVGISELPKPLFQREAECEAIDEGLNGVVAFTVIG